MTTNRPTNGPDSDRPGEGGHLTDEDRHALLEGELDAGAEARARRHLEACEECREVQESLEDLRRRARALPREVEPERDLWPEVEARIRDSARRPGGAAARGGSGQGKGARPRRFGGWTAGLAAAAAVAALFAGGLFVLQDGERTADGTGGGTAVEAPPARLVAEAREVEEAYAPTLSELRTLVDSRELAPETREVLEESLAIIEEAIREAREAVERDPAGTRALERLRRMYDAKVDVLRLVAEHGPRA